MLRILADQCVNASVIESLRNLPGLQVKSAMDEGLSRASDAEIFAYCLKHSLILVTFDKDFGNIIRFNIRKSRGIVIIYIEGMSRDEIVERAAGFFRHTAADKIRGRLFVVESETIRIWPK